jgi:hypothetical protein
VSLGRSLITADAWLFPFVSFVNFCSKSHFLLFLDLRWAIRREVIRNLLARDRRKRKTGNAIEQKGTKITKEDEICQNSQVSPAMFFSPVGPADVG